MSTTPLSDGTSTIKAALKDMPTKPGVYRMLSAAGDVLYVGKAKNLKNRVSNYTSVNQLTTRIMRMVSQVRKVEIVTTASEAEALLLEANMIKSLKPRYNILLRDDKSFPYIAITKHDFPRIVKHRGAQKKGERYFGPFASAGAVNKTIATLQKAFLLRPCSDSIFSNRTRPCLQYQIKRCSAPCVDYISKEDYGALIEESNQFLHGRSRDIQARLVEEMEAASASMEFEQAAALRDRIRALTQVQQEQGLKVSGISDADVLALCHGAEVSCVQVFFFRGGNHFGHQSYFPRHSNDSTPEEVLAAFIGQFYQRNTPPKEMILSDLPADHVLLQEALSLRVPYQVKLYVPKRGDKREAVQQASRNAVGALERHVAAKASDASMLKRLAELFGMDESPKRIEVYDNSHIMGSHALGAMISATPEGFDKSGYRRFNIKDFETEPGDDYGMMREVFTRRFKRLQTEDPEREREQWPDLALIDGGLGQLSVVQSALEEIGVENITLVAIAKGPDRNAGREQFFMPDRSPFQLPPGDPALHYLQRLRDEAHRFAIGSHRNKRSKATIKSELDNIPNVGATRKKSLLNHFGSKAAVERATLAELQNVPGINKAVAQTIYDYFNG